MFTKSIRLTLFFLKWKIIKWDSFTKFISFVHCAYRKSYYSNFNDSYIFLTDKLINKKRK